MSTPAMMRQTSAPRHSRCLDLQQKEAHCYPADKYHSLVDIRTIGIWDGSSTAETELSTIPVRPGSMLQLPSPTPSINLYVILPRKSDAPISRQRSNQGIEAMVLP